MDSMFSMLDIIIVASGVYVLYTYYLMKFKGEVKETILLPKDVSVKKCKDLQGYIGEMSPRVLIYGIIVVLSGIAGMLEDFYHIMGNLYIIALVVFGAGTVWFIVQTKKIIKKYWP